MIFRIILDIILKLFSKKYRKKQRKKARARRYQIIMAQKKSLEREQNFHKLDELLLQKKQKEKKRRQELKHKTKKTWLEKVGKWRDNPVDNRVLTIKRRLKAKRQGAKQQWRQRQ